ncbi:hypothetical protein SAMN05192544_100519 [Paraburkholderia hospita]|nr:hypothetical protein PMI06_000523 [Burkholderia sp. BT03]SEH63206.1 hypothetical protein SAMN05192544_100519 [Paraburkholderia hospita]
MIALSSTPEFKRLNPCRASLCAIFFNANLSV